MRSLSSLRLASSAAEGGSMPCLAARGSGPLSSQAPGQKGPRRCCGVAPGPSPLSQAPLGSSKHCPLSATALPARSTACATSAWSATSTSSARTTRGGTFECSPLTTLVTNNSKGGSNRRGVSEAVCQRGGGEWEDGARGVQWSAAELAEVSGGDLLAEGDPGSVVTDTRQLRPGDWFLALRGPNFNGNAFLQAARDAGSAGAVAESPMPAGWDRGYVAVEDGLQALQSLGRSVRGRFRGPVVGITGSTGKSTATALTHLALQPLGPIHKTAGNLNNHVGVPLSLLAMRKHSAACVLEMGMSAEGEIAELAGICQPGIRVVLNVGPAHLDSLGTLEAVARAKGELVASACPGDTCILNADDPLVASMPVPAGCRTVWFGSHERADVQLVGASVEHVGTSIRVRLRHHGGGPQAGAEGEGAGLREGGPSEAEVVVRTPLVEVASLCAAAVAAAVTAGVPFPEAVQSLAAFAPSQQRMHTRPLLLAHRGPSSGSLDGTAREHPGAVRVTLIDDCYNANPVSVRAALRLLLSLGLEGVRCHAFLGDMLELGQASSDEHRRVLQTCARLAAPGPEAGASVTQGERRQGRDSAEGVRLGLVGPNYREALVSLQAQGWRLPGFNVVATETASDMAAMVRTCIEERVLREGDVVLVKGSRGMRMDLVVDAFLAETVNSELSA